MTRAQDRILDRLCAFRGGTSTATTDGWKIDIPGEYAFTQRIDDNRLSSDARLDRYTVEQARAVAVFTRELAMAITRESVTFASFDEVERFLTDELEDEPRYDDDDDLVIEVHGAEITIRPAHDGAEDWIELVIPFGTEIDPRWMLEQNATRTGIAFAQAPGERPTLRSSLPLAVVTGQRLIEVIENLSGAASVLVVQHMAQR